MTYNSCSQCGGTGQVTRVTKTILGQMQTATTGTSCHGQGKLIDKRPKGTDTNGMLKQEEVVSINIPAGVEEGMHLSCWQRKCCSI